MNPVPAVPLLLALVLSLPSGLAWSQKAPAPEPVVRMQVNMERSEFLKTHRWDAPTDLWMLRNGVEPPAGVMPRADVRAARDEFLRLHRWDVSRNGWLSLKTAPRNLSAMTSDQMRQETRQFLATYRWDEPAARWLEKSPRKSAKAAPGKG